jgi:hypothetical protein
MTGVTLVSPPAILGPDPFGRAAFLGFEESQNVTLERALRVDGGWIPAGTLVSSHYILYDPTRITRMNATIGFDADVLGVISKGRRLRRSDWLGVPGVKYRRFHHRGHERRDSWRMGEDGQSVVFRHRAKSPGDYIRVITVGRTPVPPPPPEIVPPPPVPEPGAALLFALGTAFVFHSTRRRLLPSR